MWDANSLQTWSTDLMQGQSKFQDFFWKNGQANSKMHMEMQRI